MKKIAKKLINFVKITNIMFKDYIKCIKYCGFPYVKKDKIEIETIDDQKCEFLLNQIN